MTNELVSAFGRSPADLAGTFVVDRGVVRTGDTVLNGNGAMALTAGAVDLPRWLIDSKTSVSRNGQTEQAPFVSVTLSGPLDSPNVKTGGEFLRSKNSAPATDPIQQILPGVLGKQPSSGGSKKIQPQDILRGLLKNLTK